MKMPTFKKNIIFYLKKTHFGHLQGDYFTGTPQFQYQQENRQSLLLFQ